MILKYSEQIRTKIAELKAIKKAGGGLQVYELIKVFWPGEAITYSATGDCLDETLPVEVRPCQVRLSADFPNLFQQIPLTSILSDDEIDVEFWDVDDGFTDLYKLHGEGVKIIVYLWCPQVNLLLEVFWGNLRTSNKSDLHFWRGTIAAGFRSPEALIPGRGHFKDECQALFGGELSTLSEIADNDCPYNRHVSGGNIGLLNGGVPFTSCDKTVTACSLRLGDTFSHLSHNTMEEAVINNQTSGATLYPKARGNETNLKQNIRVIMGFRWVYDLQPMAIIKQFNNNNQNQGFVRALYGDVEGPIGGWQFIRVNDTWIDAVQTTLRNGDRRQPATNFSPNAFNYSGTAYFQAVLGPVNPAGYNSSNLRAQAHCKGLNIKVFNAADANDFTIVSGSNNRACQIIEVLTNKRWGYGLDISTINMTSFYECQTWGNQYVNFTDPNGTVWGHYRSVSEAELVERQLGQQLEDMCLAGNFSRPFLWLGKLHILPLRALTTQELADVEVFTDNLDKPNILVSERDGLAMPEISYSQESDLKLPNRIEVSFDNVANFHKAENFSVQDETAQLAAGIKLGNKSRRKITKKYSLLGVCNKAAAVKNAWKILDLGAFEEGGLKNNLAVSIKIDWLDGLEMYPTKVIKILNPKINGFGFEYFRIKELFRNPDLSLSVVSQAYNHEYLSNLEVVTTAPTGGGGGGGTGGGNTCELEFGTITFDPDGNFLIVPIEPC